MQNVKMIGNTTLSDIEYCMGEGAVELLRFGGFFGNKNDQNSADYFQTIQIRRPTKSDKKHLRNSYRFLPADCWVCVWKDPHYQFLIPFIQKEDASVIFLMDDPRFMIAKPNQNRTRNWKIQPDVYAKRLIELIPDYFSCIFATVSYRHTQIIIPINPNTAKNTFKDRDRDIDGVKRQLIHNVRSHTRQIHDGKTSVKDHLRGTSDITIDGVDVVLYAPADWSARELSRLLKGERMEMVC